jgi:riboflavin-specific deaminase-like protein
MSERPYVLLSVATSVDGYIDDASGTRLVLSNAVDLERVDALRASCDAILVGAGTLRRDNPRLTVKSPRLRAERAARGLAPQPLRVTVTASGDLDAGLKVWHQEGTTLVYCPPGVAPELRARLGGLAKLQALETVEVGTVLADLGQRGVRRLLVEGGATIHTWFLTADLVDELQLAIAPFFVGDPAAPRLVNPGRFPFDREHRMTLAGVRSVGDMAVLRYLAGDVGRTASASSSQEDLCWMERAIALASHCPPSARAYSVGAIIVDGQGNEMAHGYSREGDAQVHAEEAALAKLPVGDPRLPSATLYSTMEPCAERRSRPRSCVQLILSAGIRRVVFACREPALFVARPRGAEQLAAAGVSVIELPELARRANDPNRHLVDGPPAPGR